MRPTGRQMGIPREEATLHWIGVPGLMWSRVIPEIERYVALDRPPQVVLVHAGGNDLGNRASRELIRDIKYDFLRLRMTYPDTVFVWSEVVARTRWRLARSVEALNKARKKVNRAVSKFVGRNGGLFVRHPELEVDTWRYLRGDGVHLNDVGTDLWCLGLQEGIQRALRVWRSSQT